uniref:Uncharacterized protein n=1 Tax=Rhizophora mucronata TaxID=61149 RepID=A0A2P2N3S2_RHIMU
MTASCSSVPFSFPLVCLSQVHLWLVSGYKRISC